MKYKLFPITDKVGQPLVAGLAEIGKTTGRIIQKSTSKEGKKVEVQTSLPDHKKVLEKVIELLCDPKDGHLQDKKDIVAIGHRVVHGGEHFNQASLINSQVMGAIQKSADLAPLHNPANILGIQVAEQLFGTKCPQVCSEFLMNSSLRMR